MSSDAARPQLAKLTFEELRKYNREQCKIKPCSLAARGKPPCVICVNERKMK